MPASFTDNEMNEIRARLKSFARECLLRYGARKTSVDQLVAEAGISKGAFYRFYKTKELLFFEIIEDFHTEIMSGALEILKTMEQASEAERLEKALTEAVLSLERLGGAPLWSEEIDYLMRKLPDDVLKRHMLQDGTQMAELIRVTGIKVSRSPDEIAAVIRALFFLLSHKKEIGENNYRGVVRFFARAVAEEILR